MFLTSLCGMQDLSSPQGIELMPWPLLWKAASWPLDHQGYPEPSVFVTESQESLLHLTPTCWGHIEKTASKNQASLVAQMVKNLPEMQETQVQHLVQEDPLEEDMATHSSILAWRIPWKEEPGGLWTMDLQRVGWD